MKKIKNMNYQEAIQSIENFSKKKSINESFDMNIQVAKDIEALADNQEAFLNAIYNVFRFGFMAGYKQNSKEFEIKHNEHFSGQHEEAHKKLTELAYYLPCGIGAEYLYEIFVAFLNNHYPNIEQMMPNKQMKAFLETIQKHDEGMTQFEAKREEKAAEEPLLTEEEYTDNITKKLSQLHDAKALKIVSDIVESLTR